MAGLLVVGCGDDEDGDEGADTTSTTAAGDDAPSEEFCDAAVAVDAAFAPEEPDPAEVRAAIETARDNAPEEVSGDIDTVLGQLDQAFQQGPSPEFNQASTNVDEYVLENCGFEEIDVSGVDFAFEGLPEQLDAGTYAFNFTNDAEAELHVMALVRINDDVTESLEELLQLPEEEARSKVTDVGGVAAEPGESDTTLIELEPGRYAAICPIPVGSVGGTEGSGPPHFVEGMAAEIEVT
jgi:hypothetical protein